MGHPIARAEVLDRRRTVLFGEWREFALRRLLRELVATAGRAEAVEALANTGKSLARRIIPRWLSRLLSLGIWWN